MLPYRFRPRVCKQCRQRFMPERTGQVAHSGACEYELAMSIVKSRQEKARRRERAKDRAKRRELETIPYLIKAAQREFNKWVRARDYEQPCISCGAPPPDLSQLHAGRDAGHYRSVGSAPHLRFRVDNVHAQCVQCNQFKSGCAVDYRIGLVGRIGLARVEALEADSRVHKWTREELRAIRDEYRRKLKELKACGTHRLV